MSVSGRLASLASSQFISAKSISCQHQVQTRHSQISDSAPVSQRREVRYTSQCRVPASSCGPLRPNVTSSIKPEVQNVAQRRRRRTEPRPRGIRIQNFVKIGPVVPEICSRTDRRTDRRVGGNTPHPYRGGVTKRTRCFGTCMKQLTLNRYQSS